MHWKCSLQVFQQHPLHLSDPSSLNFSAPFHNFCEKLFFGFSNTTLIGLFPQFMGDPLHSSCLPSSSTWAPNIEGPWESVMDVFSTKFSLDSLLCSHSFLCHLYTKDSLTYLPTIGLCLKFKNLIPNLRYCLVSPSVCLEGVSKLIMAK